MSETQNTEPTPNESNNKSNSSEEERKKQFERMKEKFSRPGSNFGGGNKGGGNSGNNFYWIYGVVIAVLLFIVFYGNGFTPRLAEVSQGKFYQDMLAKGDVTDVVIVNKTIARIYINPDSAAICNRYKDPKTAKSLFPDK